MVGILLLAILASQSILLANALVICTTYSGTTLGHNWGDPLRYTDDTFYPNTESFTFTGTIDPSSLPDNHAVFFGLLDKKAVDDDIYFESWAGGAYVYFGRRGNDLVVGPSDGFLGGEIVQVFKTYSGYFAGPMDPIEVEVTLYDGYITVTLDGTDYIDDYGAIKTFNNINAYAHDEFEYGAYLGIDSMYSTSDVDYELSYCIETDLDVIIDVKPDSDTNPINMKSNGNTPVAILTTEDFDATTVDPVTVSFAMAMPLRWSYEDVNYDGYIDLLFIFKTQELALTSSDTEALILGKTFSEETLGGIDTVTVKE